MISLFARCLCNSSRQACLLICLGLISCSHSSSLAPPPPPVVSVSVSPNPQSVQISTSLSFMANVTNTNNPSVTWSLSGTGCSGAACGTLTNVAATSVTYSAPATVPNPATVTLTATLTSDTSKFGTATITIVSSQPPVVSVSPNLQSVQVSTSQLFTANVTNTNNPSVAWSLSGTGCSGAACGTLTNVAATSVTYNAPATVPNPATVTLTATLTSDTTKTGTASITVTGSTGTGGSPALVQHVSHSNTQSHSVNNYGVRFVFPTGSGNCVLVGVQSSGGSIPTVADDKGNTYTQVINGSDTTNTQITLFKAPVTHAGAQNLQVAFSSAASFVAAEASEFMNVDASCTLDGAANKGSGSGTALAAGNLNTTANGDLIWAFGIQDSSSSNINSWTAGNSFALLGADVMDGHFSEWQVQSAAGSINPGATLSPSRNWFMAAMAIKAGNSGTAPSGIHGVHNLHLAFPNGQVFPMTVQFPCTTTNGPIVVIGNAEPSNDFAGLSDSNTNHWTKRGAAQFGNSSGFADIWDTDAATTTCSPNMTVNINKTGVDTIGSTLIFIDVGNCGPQPCFDSGPGYASATGQQTSGPANVTGASATPTTSTGACFSSMAVDAHTITGILAPALFLSSVATKTGSVEDADFPDDENNGYAVIYNPGAAKFTLVWQESDILNNWANGITCYKGQ